MRLKVMGSIPSSSQINFVFTDFLLCSYNIET